MANVEEKKSVPERIDKNDNWEFSQQEIKDFIFDKKNGQQNIKDLVNFLEESMQNRIDPYGKDKYFVDNFQNIMDGLEISEMFTKIDEKINKNENLTNDEKSLIYLDAITVGKRRKSTYDMSSGGIIHREIFLKNSKTPFNPNDPIRKICDGEFLNYIRCCYGNQNYNPEQYSPIPDKGSTIQDNKNYIKDPVKFKQEKEKEKIKSEYEGLPQIPPISQRGNEYIHSYCNMIYKRAEDNGYLVMAEYESRLRNEFRSHVEYNENGEGEYVHDKEFDAYVRYDKLLFAFQKYCEVINKKHEQVIKEAGYHDIDEFSQEMKYFGLFQDLIKEKYPDLEEVLKRLEPYWTEIEENKNKYFGGKSDEEIEKAGKDFLEFQEFQNKKNEEYGITNEMIESLNETPSTKEETENYFKNLDKILKFQCELNIKRGEYGEDTIDNYYEYITSIKNIQGKYNESDFNILKNYSTDLQQRGKSINFDRCSKYAAMIDRKGKYSQLGKDLENVGIISEILSDPTGEYFPIFEVKNAEMEKKLKQESIDKTRENIKKHAPGLYRVSTVVTGFWNGLVDSTIGVGTSLGAMITGLIGGKDHYQSQMQKKERWDNFFKINQTSSQKQAVYDPESGSLNFKRDNTVTTVSSSIAQMLCLIYGGSAVGKGIGKLGTKAGLTISENVVSRAGLFGMSFITQVGQSYGEAINSGLDGTGAFAYSMLSASIQSGLELVSPNDVLLGKGTGLGKQLISSICKNEGGIKLVGKYFLKSVGREILEENLQEGLQLAAGNLVNDMVNGVRNTGLESDRNPKNFLSTAIITTLTTGITTGFSAGKKGLQMMRSSQPQLMARISSDQDLYNDVINIINNSINGKFQIPNVDPKQLTALKYTLELMNTEGNNDQQENSQNNAENNNQEPENQENTDTETQTKKKREKKKDKDYFDGQSHEFDVTQDQAIKNSQYMDNILESINEGNMVNELDNLRKRISEQYHEATGENIELTDEQLLSILDAHEQDGILGELTIGQLKQKVKILSETVTDPKFRRFLFEAGFCGKYLELTELQQEKIDYLRKHEVRINEENIDYLSTLTESEMREISSFQMDCGISFIKTDAAKLLQLSEEEKEWVIEASKFGFVDYKYDDVMEISKIDEKGKNILRELNTIGLEGSFSSYSVKDLSKLTSNDVNKLKKMKSMGYPIRYFFYDIIENLSNDQINMLYQLYKMRVEIPGVGWSEIVGKMTPEIVTKIKNEGSAEITLEGGEKVNLVRDSYFNGKAHQFNVTESQAIDNSQKMDYILNNVNEENLSQYLQSMREDINEQYFVTTGEDIELTDEQLLSILDAHEQDGILGELTIGQLKQKVKILSETVTDPKIRRFLLEAGFCGQEVEIKTNLEKLQEKLDLMCESNVTAENCGLTEEQINQVYDLFGKIKGITGQDKLTETQLKRIVEEKIKVNDLEYVSGIRDRLKILTGNETISFETMLKILSYNEYFFDKAISEASLKTGNKRIETELCRFFDTYFLYLTDNEFKNKLIKIVGNEYQDILGTLFTADPNKINNILDIILNSQQTYTKLEQMHTELKMSRGGLLNMFSEFDNFEFDGMVFKLTKDGRTEYMILNEYGVIELEYIGNKTYIFHAGMSTEDPKMKLKVHYLVGKIFKHMANQIPEGYRITETHSLSGNSFPLFLREYQSDFTTDYIVKATGKMIYLNSQGVDTELSKLISDLNVGENDDIFEASTRENAEKVVKKINELILKDHGKSINDGKGIQGLPTATVVESLETGLRRVAIPQIEILKEHNNGAELAQKLNKCTTYNEMENILLENLTTEYHFRDGDLTGEELLQRCRAYRETYVNGGDKLPKNVNPRKFFPSEFIVPSKRKSTDGKPIWRNTTWKSHIHKLLDSK